MREIRTFEAFAGYGSQCLAMEALHRDFGLRFTPVGCSEIDPAAIRAYDALHPGVANYGDISRINWHEVPDFDLFVYSFPCTDISAAGVQKGLSEGSGTRSSLLWECRKAVEAKRPRYLLMENVKALVQRKFIGEFHKWLRVLEDYGYANFWQVLNAKDYGVPQNRERVFCVSILRTEDDPEPRYYFPRPFPLEKRLADMLEDEVDEKFFLSGKMLARFCEKSLENETSAL